MGSRVVGIYKFFRQQNVNTIGSTQPCTAAGVGCTVPCVDDNQRTLRKFAKYCNFGRIPIIRRMQCTTTHPHRAWPLAVWAGVCLWCWVLLMGTAQAQARPSVQADPISGELPVQREVWADPTGQATLEQATTQIFRPAPRVMALGYPSGTTWLRVTVPPTTTPNLWAIVQPSYLDNVRLYSRPWLPNGQPGDWTLRQVGDRFAFNDREKRTLFYSLGLDTSATRPTVLYVRLESTSTHMLYVNVRTQSSALEFEEHILLLLGLYLGVVLVLTWMSLVRFVITRDMLWALNVLLQLGTVTIALCFLGLAAKYLMPTAPQGVDTLTSVTVVVHLWLSMLYYGRLVTYFRASRWVVWGYAAFLLPLPWQLWQLAQGQGSAALALNSNLVLLASVLGLIGNWWFRIDDTQLKWTVRFAYSVQTAYLAVLALLLLGVGNMQPIHLYPAMGLNLLGSMMQYMVLTRRDQLTLQAQRQLERDMQATQHELSAKQRQLTESTSFMAMLLHELKNPLASVRLAAQNLARTAHGLAPEHLKRLARIEASVDSMDSVLERCRQVDRLETDNWHTVRQSTNMAQSLADTVAQQTGHQRVQLHSTPNLVAQVSADFFQTIAANLLDNALAYSPPDSPVEVSLREEASPAPHLGQHQMVLTVCNMLGKAGLPDPQRVFSKYYRAQGAHQRTGSGLGLYLVKSLAEKEHGSIVYRAETTSDGNMRAVFELRLPCN